MCSGVKKHEVVPALWVRKQNALSPFYPGESTCSRLRTTPRSFFKVFSRHISNEMLLSADDKSHKGVSSKKFMLNGQTCIYQKRLSFRFR